MPRATIELVPTDRVDAATLAAMWSLYAPHHAITRAQFEERCHADVDAIALYRAPTTRALVGFTGVRRRLFTLRSGEAVATVYFGTSFIAAEWRGHNLIQRTVLRVFFAAKGRRPWRRLFVWSDALSVRPYLLTARSLYEYYPSPLRPMPDDVRELRDTLGRTYYGDCYDPARGTVRKPSRKLDPQLLEIDADGRDDLHVRYYIEQNPGYIDGHGLLIIQPATVRNALAFAWIQVRRAISRILGNGRRSRS